MNCFGVLIVGQKAERSIQLKKKWHLHFLSVITRIFIIDYF